MVLDQTQPAAPGTRPLIPDHHLRLCSSCLRWLSQRAVNSVPYKIYCLCSPRGSTKSRSGQGRVLLRASGQGFQASVLTFVHCGLIRLPSVPEPCIHPSPLLTNASVCTDSCLASPSFDLHSKRAPLEETSSPFQVLTHTQPHCSSGIDDLDWNVGDQIRVSMRTETACLHFQEAGTQCLTIWKLSRTIRQRQGQGQRQRKDS